MKYPSRIENVHNLWHRRRNHTRYRRRIDASGKRARRLSRDLSQSANESSHNLP